MTVHFVGAGPGAADLLTLRAVALLNAADVCVYAGTYIDHAVLDHCPDGAQLVDTQDLDLDQITARIVDAHAAGLEVVRLCSGDPSIYSALHEQAKRLDAHGVPWDVTPGVPAYAAAAALLGAELTVPEVVQSVVLTRTQARSTAMPSGEALAGFAATGSTLVLHLAITRTRTLAAELAESYGADCPVAVVAECEPADRGRAARHPRRHRRPGRGRGTASGGGHPRRQGAGRGRTRGRVVPLRPGSRPFGQAALSQLTA